MASGRAVVASDIPGYRSVITPGENALAVPPGDVPALADAIASLVLDPERRRRLGCKGHERAQEFSWPRVTDRIESVYRRVVERRRSAASAA